MLGLQTTPWIVPSTNVVRPHTTQDRRPMALLSDVAKLAGVSLATASRAFGDPDRLAAATRDRVLAAAAAVGYEGATASERTFGVIVPDIANAVFAALVKSMQNRAWPGRHRMVLIDTNEDIDREREHLRQTRGLDGVILCSPRLAPDEIGALVATTPLVVINGEAPGATSVLMETGQGVTQAVEHLAALGHRRIGFVPGPASAWANRQRLAALTSACATFAVELSAVGNQAATVHGGSAAAASVAVSGATAVVAYNDLVALGLESGLRALGYRCPDDISIIGIDDLDVAAASEPGLTSIRVAIERSGSVAVELLLERISGKPSAEAVHLDSQLIVRGSTAVAHPRAQPAQGD
jgi:DNA-binding LacI/PurR family transcriptional regulator